MKNRIIVAGNIIVDRLYPISGYPERGQLTTVLDGIGQSTGGLVCNVGIDLKRLMPDTEVAALGLVGKDDLAHPRQDEGADHPARHLEGDLARRGVLGEGVDLRDGTERLPGRNDGREKGERQKDRKHAVHGSLFYPILPALATILGYTRSRIRPGNCPETTVSLD